MEELAADPNMKRWFVDGVTRLEQGLLLGGSPGARACLTSMINAALAAAACALPTEGAS
jgi:hypothetical protein